MKYAFGFNRNVGAVGIRGGDDGDDDDDYDNNNNNNNNNNIFTAIWLSPGGSGYFTCKQNMKLVTTKFQ